MNVFFTISAICQETSGGAMLRVLCWSVFALCCLDRVLKKLPF